MNRGPILSKNAAILKELIRFSHINCKDWERPVILRRLNQVWFPLHDVLVSLRPEKAGSISNGSHAHVEFVLFPNDVLSTLSGGRGFFYHDMSTLS